MTFKNSLNNILEVIKELNHSYVILPSHIILSLFFLYSNGSGGKYSLSKFLAIPTSRSRKIIDILKSFKLVNSLRGRNGTVLTKKGQKNCEILFSNINILTPEKTWDLGNLTLGKYDILIAVPINLIKNKSSKINVVNIRDTAMKIGALGASIFHTYYNSNNKFELTFYESDIELTTDVFQSFNNEFFNLSIKLEPLLRKHEEWLVIASTVNEIPKNYYYNPIFDSNIVKTINILHLAGMQAIWELLTTL